MCLNSWYTISLLYLCVIGESYCSDNIHDTLSPSSGRKKDCIHSQFYNIVDTNLPFLCAAPTEDPKGKSLNLYFHTFAQMLYKLIWSDTDLCIHTVVYTLFKFQNPHNVAACL